MKEIIFGVLAGASVLVFGYSSWEFDSGWQDIALWLAAGVVGLLVHYVLWLNSHKRYYPEEIGRKKFKARLKEVDEEFGTLFTRTPAAGKASRRIRSTVVQGCNALIVLAGGKPVDRDWLNS